MTYGRSRGLDGLPERNSRSPRWPSTLELLRDPDSERGVHSIRSRLEHPIGEVAVHVRGGRQVRVAEHPRHDGKVHTLLDEHRGGRVAEVVEPLMGESGPRQGELEVASHVPGIERRALVSGEYVSREAPGITLPGHLPAAMLPQCIGHEWGELEQPSPAVCLRCGERPSTTLERVLNAQRTGVEVHVDPSQAEQLTLSHAGTNRGGIEGLEPISAERIEERPNLRRAEGSDLPLGLAWRVNKGGHVADDLALLRSPSEGDPQDGVHVPDSGGGEARPGTEPCQQGLDVLGAEPCQWQPA